MATIRPAAVTGVFYPADPHELRTSIERLLTSEAHSKSESVRRWSSFPMLAMSSRGPQQPVHIDYLRRRPVVPNGWYWWVPPTSQGSVRASGRLAQDSVMRSGPGRLGRIGSALDTAIPIFI